MSIPTHCKSLSSTLSRNLYIASSSEQPHALAADTLDEMGKRLFPELDKLLAEKGEASDDYRRAHEAVLELLTFVTIHFVRNCSEFSRGIQFLEELTDRSDHSQIKKKLVTYTNQLKKRWNETEPNVIAHNPRAKRVRRRVNVSPDLANAIRIILFLASTFYLIAHMDLTSLVFPSWNEPRPAPAPQVQVDSQDDGVQLPQNIPDQQQTEAAANPLERVAGSFYTYTDERGVVHMVNDLEKVPEKYRNSMKVTRSPETHGNVTPVAINGNRVVVPVTISFRGRSVEAKLLLDTGASTTTVNGRLVSLLGVEASDVRAGKATLADGRSVSSYMFVADSLAVGSHSLSQVRTSVLPGSGGGEYDGLLGMDFLKNFRYHVDFDRSVIEWGA